jgi:dTDP-4-dehydrorhamnose reductase
MNKRRKILFTGGSGLLALNWALHIAGQYDVVLGLHNRDITVPGLNTIPLHMESEDALLRTFEQVAPDMVIHCAGLANVEQCEADPALAYHVNVKLSSNVAKACNTMNVQMVYICTDHLFSGNQPLVTEQEPVSPVNVYGRTKWEGENEVLSVSGSFLSIRTNFYGWGPSYRKSFSDFIIEGIRNGRTVNLFEDFFYTPILIEDLAHAVMSLLDKNASGVYNVTGNGRISKYEFGIRLCERFGLDSGLACPVKIRERKDLVKRPYDLSLSNQKMESLLGRIVGDINGNIDMLWSQEKKLFANSIRQT